ncbi:MAG: hypothetical protein JGK24_25955 [Microcoleus sp. PH2017_29_MFU_D_A]|nr:MULTISPECIES: hypothetical protein [unclassified Microcoleus]MCC3418654.1 hypothetical protein [Microcoleus sp. PH2017_07_MST_O_A]MCC3442531.1 hypothetical protein [Microcoleus sp. PH2017_03_ELD_O_A]MCC3466572.1 hypothetical protein [Microcoleus sp. PH2017_06_SFM_O_A]MCC3505790.1 hypothetical protein [Microcoleus sp. PH2017_19_SFW_U_A]MCC3513156.1 hypothetical protein [Microcoleus sp. PH2017_17_BER_D_A]
MGANLDCHILSGRSMFAGRETAGCGVLPPSTAPARLDVRLSHPWPV